MGYGGLRGRGEGGEVSLLMMEGLGWGWMAWFVEGECIIASFGWIVAFEAFAWALLACQVGLVRVDKDIDKVE